MSRYRTIMIGTALTALAALGASACSTSDDSDDTGSAPTTSPAPSTAPTTTTSSQPAPTSPASSTQASSEPSDVPAVGAVVRFSSPEAQVDVTITGDNPTARDFLSMLPLTLSFEEFAGREKISYLPRQLDTEGSPGHDPEDGDLIYFAPWGNLGFYYNTAGIGFDDRVIHLGTYQASEDQLAGLEGHAVTVAVVE